MEESNRTKEEFYIIDKKDWIEKRRYCWSLVDVLQNLDLKEMSEKLNSDQNSLVKSYNAKNTISDQVSTIFIKWLEYFKNQGGEIIFTGWFDQGIMDILSGPITDLKIEDGKVKVAFVMDDGTPRTDEVELKDAFCPDFSFHCK